MEFTRAGLDVYTTEVDDKGIDFVIRQGSPGQSAPATYIDVQVKSVTGLNYIFLAKEVTLSSDKAS